MVACLLIWLALGFAGFLLACYLNGGELTTGDLAMSAAASWMGPLAFMFAGLTALSDWALSGKRRVLLRRKR